MMDIFPLMPEKYGEWDEFCLNSDDAWFFHTSAWLEYAVSYNPSLNARSLSFLVCDDTGILAVCPLILEQVSHSDKQVKRFSNSGEGGYISAPALRNDLKDERRDKLLKHIYYFIDEQALANDVKVSFFRLTPLSVSFNSNKVNHYNYLMKYGYYDNSLNAQIIDLGLSEDALWHNVRKGHKYDIKRGEKAYSIKIFDKTNITKEIFDRYRLLHHKAAGKMTRPIDTFKMMYQWILNGQAILCGAQYNEDLIGISYISIYKDGASYGSSADDPDIKLETPISHVIQWQALKWLKANGYRYYFIGIQQFGLQIYDFPSKKDMDISLFKRGFGGQTVPLFRGEKLYDDDFMKTIFQKRLEELFQCSQVMLRPPQQ